MAPNDLPASLQVHRSRPAKIANRLATQRELHGKLGQAIEHYKSFDTELENIRVHNLDETANELSKKIADKDKIQKKIFQELREVKSRQSNPLAFWKMFTPEQRLLRAEVDRLARDISASEKRLKNDKDALSRTIESARRARSNLKQHANFNLDNSERLYSELGSEIKRLEEDYATASAELSRIEVTIRSHIQEYDRLKSSIATLNADIAAADRFDQELSAAANSYERAQIHQKCEVKFGTRSPKYVTKDRSGQIRSLENNLSKINRRISDEIRKFDRKIEYLVIDGNNTCYEGQSFIGLRAISALTAELASRYKATVVFDASIRSLLKTDTQGIERALGSTVSTYVAPTKTAADEYILKLANENQNTYILSNDRYAEYHEYDVVKSGRCIRFMIADNKFMINDIDILVNFQ
ncbi:NYN domain-containing protein [Amaricoccus solimangrovi]|uniref:RNase NYN domain-containing protein n=1 Tax=Amaricoccus solimangrovi TaxID=2589815 RepID=A0A501WPV0_9RHOB|nr:hypothetical protein [Amaricoccus solimangrovi]TPE49267.1 hypothetical protein FJM51_15400 [Amaricoccus solimangrovi]